MLLHRKKIVISITLALSLAQNPATAQFDPVFELSGLNGQNGIVINGVSSDNYSGVSIDSAGDINGDGIDDVIIGADGVEQDGNFRAGASYVVFGSDSGLPNPLNLSSLNGLNGITFNGSADEFSSTGGSVSSAGDVNGDGIDDLIIGSRAANPDGIDNAGSSYVVFGSNSGLPNPFDLLSLNGLNGFIINGATTDDFSGSSVSAAGDINGDGIDDLIIGAVGANTIGISSTGSSYVVFGSDSGLPHPLNLSSINGLNGFTLNGIGIGDSAGNSVSAAGDVNGDGIDDLIIGAPFANSGVNSDNGSSYVVFGSDSGLPNPFNLADLNGLNGFSLNGVDAGDYSGISVSAAGDINGDGIDDIIIGAPLAGPNGNSNAGSGYVVFGSSSPLPNPFEISTLNGLNGFSLNGISQDNFAGNSVSAAGDVNGDGIDDLIIGSLSANPGGIENAGSSYVVFGSETTLPNPFNPALLNGSNGFIINGVAVDDRSGGSVSAAGDVNNDGIDDLIIGATGAGPNGNSSGSTYVVFGIEKPIFKDGFE